MGEEVLGAVDHAPEVDVHDPLEILVGEVLEVSVQCHPGVVDQGVDPAEVGHDRVGVGLPGLPVADVERVRARGQAGRLLDQQRGLLQAGGVHVGEHHRRAPAGGEHGEAAPDAGRGAGDDDDPAGAPMGAHAMTSSRCGASLPVARRTS